MPIWKNSTGFIAVIPVTPSLASIESGPACTSFPLLDLREYNQDPGWSSIPDQAFHIQMIKSVKNKLSLAVTSKETFGWFYQQQKRQFVLHARNQHMSHFRRCDLYWLGVLCREKNTIFEWIFLRATSGLCKHFCPQKSYPIISEKHFYPMYLDQYCWFIYLCCLVSLTAWGFK